VPTTKSTILDANTAGDGGIFGGQFLKVVGAIDGQSSEVVQTKTQIITAFTWQDLGVQLTGTGAVSTFRSRNNGSNGNQIVTTTLNTPGWYTDSTHTDSVSANTPIDVNRSTNNGPTVTIISSTMAASTPLVIQGSNSAAAAANFSTTKQFLYTHGSIQEGSTESDLQVTVRAAGTWKNTALAVNGSPTNTVTFTVRNNGADGNQTISVAGGTAANTILSDSTHTDSIVSGDLICHSAIQVTASSGSMRWCSSEFVGTISAQDVRCQSDAIPTQSVSLSASTSYYWPLGGQLKTNTTEVNAKFHTPYAFTLSKLRCRIYVNTAATMTLKSRVNGADGNSSVSVGSGVTGVLQDSTHTDSYSAGNDVNFTGVTGTLTLLGIKNAAATIDDGTVTGSVDATGSGSIGTLTLTAPTGSASAIATGSGTIPTLTLSAPAGSGQASETADGALGTLILSAPTGSAYTDESGTGDIPTLTLTPPEGEGLGTGTAQGPIGTLVLTPPQTLYAYDTQLGLNTLVTSDPDARATQFGLGAMAQPDAVTRTTQMGLLVLASGGEAPLRPDPLTLHDYGRDQVLYQRLVNMYVEPTPQGPATSARYPRPGLYTVATRGGGPVRKTFLWKGFRFTVSGGVVFRDAIAIGNVPSTGSVRYAFSDEEVVIVAGGVAWYVNLPDQDGATISQITDPDLPANVIDVVQLAGRFVYAIKDSSQYYYSEVGDAQNIDGLNFATDAENSADHIVGMAVTSGNLVFFNTLSVEWWYPVVDPDNPFYRSSGRRNDKGCVAQDSIVEADNTLFFVTNDKMVCRALSVPLRVSDYAVEDKLRRVPSDQLSQIKMVPLNFGGHAFLIFHIPGEGSWVLDIGQKLWYNWQSYGKDFWRVNCADPDGFIGDMYSGDILGVDGKHFYDLVSDPIVKVVSTFVKIAKGYIRNFNLLLSCSRGVGVATGQGSDPVVEMHFSDNEGRTWSNWIPATLGAMGDGSDNAKAIWTQLGAIRSPGRLFEFRCSDPVFFAPWEVRFNEERL
jgi:hypothetical protein